MMTMMMTMTMMMMMMIPMTMRMMMMMLDGFLHVTLARMKRLQQKVSQIVAQDIFVNSVYERNSFATLQIFFLLRKRGDFFRLSSLLCPFSMYQTEAALTPEYILN